MGNLIKINIYAERKKENTNKLRIQSLEKNISKYNRWLRNTNREDKIESYEEFLQAE